MKLKTWSAENSQVCGDALALCTKRGADLTAADWERLDNAIYEQLADPAADVQAVAADCRAGGWWGESLCVCCLRT